jgi:trk system potassium uptake protein
MTPPNLMSKLSMGLFRSPARIAILGFTVLITAGALLLMLPAATSGSPLSFIDALFMSTSASCVTGLSVMDVGLELTRFGQLVLLSLIQVGGLGILTLSTLLLLMLKGRPSISGQAIIKETFTYGGAKHTAAKVLKAILATAISIELAGALLLYLRTAPTLGWREAAYPALFHSVSAFCNAGFSLYSDSLVGFREDWIVNGVIGILIILGGIGFIVIADVKNRYFDKRTAVGRLSLHSRLALTASTVLILLGTVAMVSMEWRNSLEGLSVPGRFLAALFQSITARTAGFNTLDLASMANETLFVLCILMFIGACPGSCGGGVKTTTIAGIVVLGMSRLRGLRRPRVFQRTLTDASIAKATGVLMISLAVVIVGAMMLMMSELGELPHAQTRGRFLELLFEAVSAFGTVGLSMGVTETLSTFGRLTIIGLMFIGRLGPLVIGLAMSREPSSCVNYAEENIMIG